MWFVFFWWVGFGGAGARKAIDAWAFNLGPWDQSDRTAGRVFCLARVCLPDHQAPDDPVLLSCRDLKPENILLDDHGEWGPRVGSGEIGEDVGRI